MERLNWQDRYAVTLDPHLLRGFSNEEGAWYESEEDVAEGVRNGEDKARLLRWVRKHMKGRLTKVERCCVELYFFRGLTYRDAAVLTKTNPSTVYRAVRRGLRKLRQAAEEEHLREAMPRGHGSTARGSRPKGRVSPRRKRGRGPA